MRIGRSVPIEPLRPLPKVLARRMLPSRVPTASTARLRMYGNERMIVWRLVAQSLASFRS
jgi:hypothetical protein